MCSFENLIGITDDKIERRENETAENFVNFEHLGHRNTGVLFFTQKKKTFNRSGIALIVLPKSFAANDTRRIL